MKVTPFYISLYILSICKVFLTRCEFTICFSVDTNSSDAPPVAGMFVTPSVIKMSLRDKVREG